MTKKETLVTKKTEGEVSVGETENKGKQPKKARPKLPVRPATELKKARPKLPVRKVFQRIIGTILLLAWTVFSIYLSNFVVVNVMVAILGGEAISEPVWEGMMFALVYAMAVLLTVVIPPMIVEKLKLEPEKQETKSKTATREALGLKGWPTWADIGLAPVGYAVYFLLATGMVAILMNFPWFNTEEKQELVYETTVYGWDRIIAFISYVVIAPIAEETIFRGWLYGKLRERFSENMSKWGGMILAVFLVSLAFAVVHQTVVVGVCVFILSIILCGLREITGTIYAGILVHMIVNGVAFYQNYIAKM